MTPCTLEIKYQLHGITFPKTSNTELLAVLTLKIFRLSSIHSFWRWKAHLVIRHPHYALVSCISCEEDIKMLW
jgi:hypothetical protein